MPALEVMDLKQKALVLEATGGNDAYGEPAVADEVDEIDCRIVYTTSDAQNGIATLIADHEVPLYSRVWDGGLADLPGTADMPPDSWLQVVSVTTTPDIKGRNIRYEHALAWFKDTPDPTTGG